VSDSPLRVFDGQGRAELGAEQAAALAMLAAAVRDLVEATVLTDVRPTDIRAAAEAVSGLLPGLDAARRPAPPVADVDGNGMLRQLASPVTGALNPIAPPIEIVALPDGTARSEFTLSPVYEGPPGCVHGGVSAMILDHVAGAAALLNGTPGMTATLDLRYRRPTPHSVPLVAEAKADRVEGRKTYVEARIVDLDGRSTVEATGMFIMPVR
jgi:uncharacterized protein (TIGR00369 family)